MSRHLRSDATPLSEDDIHDIINSRHSMKRASEAMARNTKYRQDVYIKEKTSTNRFE